MRLSWFTWPVQGRRRTGRRRRGAAGGGGDLRVRRLERRRVLDATLASFAVSPTLIVDGQGVTTADTGQEPLTFDWSAADAGNDGSAQNADGDSNQQANVTASVPESSLSADDAYLAEMQAAAGAASSAVVVDGIANVRPVLVVALDQTVDEGELLDFSGTGGAPSLGLFVDPDVGDVHQATVNWGDGSATEMATITSVPGAGALGGSHIYDDDGTYTVTVSVMDSNGGNDCRQRCAGAFRYHGRHDRGRRDGHDRRHQRRSGRQRRVLR